MNNNIDALTSSIGQQLSALERVMSEQKISRVEIRFPRGFIRTRSYHERRLAFLSDGIARRNIAYTLQVTDVNRWVLDRFDLMGPAESLFVKQATITVVSILEAILQAVWDTEHPDSRKSLRFVRLIDAVAAMGALSDTTINALHEARLFRNQIHFHSVQVPEWNRYGREDYTKTVQTLHGLLDDLSAHYDTHGGQPRSL